MWVRGLKLWGRSVGRWVRRSHPVWVRGLKHEIIRHGPRREAVAPCVGAWIETATPTEVTADSIVAPCVGAWIETHKEDR